MIHPDEQGGSISTEQSMAARRKQVAHTKNILQAAMEEEYRRGYRKGFEDGKNAALGIEK